MDETLNNETTILERCARWQDVAKFDHEESHLGIVPGQGREGHTTGAMAGQPETGNKWDRSVQRGCPDHGTERDHTTLVITVGEALTAT